MSGFCRTNWPCGPPCSGLPAAPAFKLGQMLDSLQPVATDAMQRLLLAT